MRIVGDPRADWFRRAFRASGISSRTLRGSRFEPFAPWSIHGAAQAFGGRSCARRELCTRLDRQARIPPFHTDEPTREQTMARGRSRERALPAPVGGERVDA